MIKVSVIIPVYNMEKYLSECLDSVVAQTLKEIEIICVNDGSTDGSEQILREYQERHSNIIVACQENGGAGAARNHGLKLVAGEFVAFLDPDDLYPEGDVLEKLYTTAVREKVSVCGGSMEALIEGKRIRKCGKLRWGSVFEKEGMLSYRDYQYAYGYTRFLYQTKLLKENHIEFPLFRRNQDPPFMVCAMIAAGKLYVIPDTVYVARVIDKKIPVYRDEIICDIASGFASMLETAKVYGMEKLQTAVQEEIHEKWMDQFYVHIFKGNERLYEILEGMKEGISKEEILRWGEEYQNEEQKFRQELEPYKEIIIYGAGKVGKEVYDYIAALPDEKNIYFAVTDINGAHTARGMEIRKIDDYLPMKKEALVIVAVTKQYQSEMESRIRQLGFENWKAVEKALIPLR